MIIRSIFGGKGDWSVPESAIAILRGRCKLFPLCCVEMRSESDMLRWGHRMDRVICPLGTDPFYIIFNNRANVIQIHTPPPNPLSLQDSKLLRYQDPSISNPSTPPKKAVATRTLSNQGPLRFPALALSKYSRKRVFV